MAAIVGQTNNKKKNDKTTTKSVRWFLQLEMLPISNRFFYINEGPKVT